MGRKIPGRKHRTIKDPYEQRAQRFAKIKDKINNPPSKNDEQEIPRSLLEIMELKEKAKNSAGKPRNRKKKKNKDVFNMKKALGKEKKLPGMVLPERHIPILQQRRKETEWSFVKRIDYLCNEIKKDVEFEEKYKVEVKRDKNWSITEVKRKESKKNSKKPTLSEKRKNKEKVKKESNEESKDFLKRDVIKFGEVVHAPISNLKAPGRKKVENERASLKPGNRDLLLKQVLTGNKTSVDNKNKASALEKQRTEERRRAVVEAFRQSKKVLKYK